MHLIPTISDVQHYYYYLVPSCAVLLLWLTLTCRSAKGWGVPFDSLRPSRASAKLSSLHPPFSIRASCPENEEEDQDDTTISDDDDSEESILAAVSMLFLEADDEIAPPNRAIDAENKLVARLLPAGHGDYEQRKPRDRQCDPVPLRELLLGHLSRQGRGVKDLWMKNSRSPGSFDDQDDPLTVFCLLEVAVTLPSQVESNVRHCITIHLHRQADESASSSLRRVALSLQNKFQQQERVLREARSLKGSVPSVISKGKALDKLLTIVVSSERENTAPIPCHPEKGSDEPDDNGIVYEPLTWSSSLSCASLWEALRNFDRCQLRLRLPSVPSEVVIPIVAYPPTILSVRTFDDFDAFVFEGIPLVVELRSAHVSHTIVTWFSDQQVVCEDSCCYTPRVTDIGKVISILVAPVSPDHRGVGCDESYKFTHRVQRRPAMPLISPLRDAWIARNGGLDDVLRIMTYNLLGDLYTNRELDQQVMYNHCPPQFLNRKRRMPLLMHELLVYEPDVICLQEVDHFAYERLFRPCLTYHGYQGFYSNKASSQLEGCAMFWSLRRFERADAEGVKTIVLRDSFRQLFLAEQRDTSMDAIVKLLERHSELKRVTCEKVGQVLQVAQLRLRRHLEGQPNGLILANTHLFYHPLAAHIRALQTCVVAQEIEKQRKANPCPVAFCGDLNAHPMSGAVQLLMLRRLDRGHYETWKHLNDYQWEMGDHEFLLEHGYIGNDLESGPTYEEEEFEDSLESSRCMCADSTSCDPHSKPVDLKLPESFPNLSSGYMPIPEFTNYAIDFAETLDYILLSEASPVDEFGLAAVRSAPLPGCDEMKAYGAMPNEVMPSDHVSLLVDARWTRFPSD